MVAHHSWVTLDFESKLEEQQQEIIIDDEDEIIKQPKGTYQKHVVNSCGLKYNCTSDKYSEPIKL